MKFHHGASLRDTRAATPLLGLVAQVADEERHGRAEDGGDDRRGEGGRTGRRARRGLVGSQCNPGEGRHDNGRDDDGAEYLGGHDPTRKMLQKCRRCVTRSWCERDLRLSFEGIGDGARVFIAEEEGSSALPCILQSGWTGCLRPRDSS